MGTTTPAFEAFFAAGWDGVVRSLTLAVGDRQIAEDAAQVAFAKAMVRWGRVSRLDRPTTWVYVVAAREARRLKARTGPEVDPVPDVGEDAEFGSLETDEWIQQILTRLPARQREAIVLRHLVGLSLTEVAEAQGVTLGTVKASLHAAHQRLRLVVNEEVSDATRGS